MDNNKGADMNQELAQAVDAVKALEQALAEANEKARQIAVGRVKEAQAALADAKRQAESLGVRAERSGSGKRTQEQRARMAEGQRKRWEGVSPEARKAWGAHVNAFREKRVQ